MDSREDANVFVHANAICESRSVGAGTRIWAFAHVLAGAQIGRDCNICDHAFVEGGARIGDRVTVKNGVLIWDGVSIEDEAFVGPGAIFTNDRYPRSRQMPAVAQRYRHREDWLTPTTVGRGATVGAGAIIICGVRIGAYASIGAGAIVTRDVPHHALVLGQPARQAGWACMCGVPLDAELCCHRCERTFVLDKDQLIIAEPASVQG